jgi:NAD(P)H-hydrate epimerase
MTQSNNLFGETLPYSLWRAELVRNQEAKLADEAGVTLYQLMERAGQAALDALRMRWPKAQRVLILAGGGNNGGDAYVVGRLARQAGLEVQLVETGDVASLPAEAAQAREEYLSVGGLAEKPAWADWQCDVIVDGLLGTGTSGEVRESLKPIIRACNEASAPVLALDVPSGLCANTGRPLGPVIKAELTLTFIALKKGLFTGAAAEYCGDIGLAGLGIHKAFEQANKAVVKRCDYNQLLGLLGRRSRISHKGDFGRVALIGGNLGMPGAIRLAGEASLRSGAGLVNVLTRRQHELAILSGRPELMVNGIDMDEMPLLTELLGRAKVLILGPGLGRCDWAQTLHRVAIEQNKLSVVDADGLNLLTQMPQWRNNWILTPHPGEAARLLGCSVAEIEENRFAAVRNIQQRFGGVCVLKGSGTLVAGDEGEVRVVNAGNPGMASGGMGDVLSGIIGGLLAQGLSLFDAACLGCCIHGLAADQARSAGERGMLASDLMPFVRKLVNPER